MTTFQTEVPWPSSLRVSILFKVTHHATEDTTLFVDRAEAKVTERMGSTIADDHKVTLESLAKYAVNEYKLLFTPDKSRISRIGKNK